MENKLKYSTFVLKKEWRIIIFIILSPSALAVI